MERLKNSFTKEASDVLNKSKRLKVLLQKYTKTAGDFIFKFSKKMKD
jgi:hypothetical protein